MKLGLLVVLAVAVLVPSLSESRTVSRCELKDQLSKAVKLPKGLEKYREPILELVAYSISKKSHLNTSLVRVFGKHTPTTTVKPTTLAVNGTTTEEMKHNATETVVAPSSGNGTNSTSGSRRKREADSDEGSGMDAGFEETGSEQENAAEKETKPKEEKEEEEECIEDGEEPEFEECEPEEEEEEGEPEEEVEEEEEEKKKEKKKKKVEKEMEEGGEMEEGKDGEEGEGKHKKSQRPILQPRQGSKAKSLRGKRTVKGTPWSKALYGLLQLSDSHFCDSGYRFSMNTCNTTCTAFTDDDISDDIACFVKTRHPTYWWSVMWTSRWYTPSKGFFKECS